MKQREEINRLLTNFDLEEFFMKEKKFDSKEGIVLDYGAVIMITPMQELLCLNVNNGLGSHNSTFYALASGIHGVAIDSYDKISEHPEMFSYHTKVINARLLNERGGVKSICFMLPDFDKISVEELDVFRDFYKKHNDTIKKISKEVGEPIVHYIDLDGEQVDSNDLDSLLEMLVKCVNKNNHNTRKVPYNEEIITINDDDKERYYIEAISSEINKMETLFIDLKECEFNDKSLLSMYQEEINEIKQSYNNQKFNKITLDYKRNIMIRISKVIDSLNYSIIMNKPPFSYFIKLNEILNIRQIYGREEYYKNINSFINSIGGLEVLIDALESVKSNKMTSLIFDNDFIRGAEQHLNSLRNKRGIVLIVKELVSGKDEELSSYMNEDKEDAIYSFQEPNKDDVSSIVNALQKEAENCKSDFGKYSVFICFLQAYKNKFPDSMTDYFITKIYDSIERIFESRPNRITQIKDFIKNNYKKVSI